MTKEKYGYMFGLPKRRKKISMWFKDEFQRNVHMAADKSLGFRTRKIKKRVV